MYSLYIDLPATNRNMIMWKDHAALIQMQIIRISPIKLKIMLSV